MLDVLIVIQNGTYEVDDYCCCNKDAYCYFCDKNTIEAYGVIKKISNSKVGVVFKQNNS